MSFLRLTQFNQDQPTKNFNMKKYVFIIAGIVFVLSGFGQGIYNSNAHIVSDLGTYWVVDNGNFTLNSQSPANLASFANLNIENDASLTISSSSYLTIQSTFNNGGTFNILSDATGTGSLITNGTINNTGTVNVDCFFEQDQWHGVSSVISDGLSGIFINSYLKYFTEADSTWTYITPLDYALTSGRGFMLWDYDDKTITYSGSLNNGNYNPDLVYTSSAVNNGKGWNLIGNPYPSSLNFDGSWTSSNIDGTIYFYNGSNYLTWNGSMGTNASGAIAPGQAFWVHAHAENPSITIPQNKRQHSTQPFYKDLQSNVFTMEVTGNNKKDQITIVFDNESSASFDPEFDAYKLFGEEDAPQLFMKFNGIEFSMNYIPKEGELSIPVFLEVGSSGNYLISNLTEPFTTYEDVFLEDLISGETVDLMLEENYSFYAEPSQSGARFLLHFYDVNGTNDYSSKQTLLFSNGSSLFINSSIPEKGELEIFDIVGRKVVNKNLEIDGQSQIKLSVPAGYYIATFKGMNCYISRKILIQ